MLEPCQTVPTRKCSKCGVLFCTLTNHMATRLLAPLLFCFATTINEATKREASWVTTRARYCGPASSRTVCRFCVGYSRNQRRGMGLLTLHRTVQHFYVPMQAWRSLFYFSDFFVFCVTTLKSEVVIVWSGKNLLLLCCAGCCWLFWLLVVCCV